MTEFVMKGFKMRYEDENICLTQNAFLELYMGIVLLLWLSLNLIQREHPWPRSL